MPQIELLLILIKLAGILAHLIDRIGDCAAGLIADLIAEVIKLLAGALTGGLGLAHLALLKGLGGLLQLLAGLIKLLAGLGGLFLILWLIHAVVEIVGIAELLFLLIAEAGKLALGVIALLLRAGLLEGGLLLAHLLI